MVKLGLGTMDFGCLSNHQNDDENILKTYFETCPSNPLWIDTAYYYKGQASLGKALLNYSTNFKISTKVNPWFNNDFTNGILGQLNKENIEKQCRSCLVDLERDCVDMLFLHSYDYETPLIETLQTVNDIYRQKEWFHQWGISNFSKQQLSESLDICEANDFLYPSSYQGMYNVMCRNVEEIFPILCDYQLRFWAYNPLCGGLLVHGQPKKTSGRFSSPIYQSLFGQHSSFVNACQEWIQTCQVTNASAFSLQWLSSQLRQDDVLLLGASNSQQLDDNIKHVLRNEITPHHVLQANRIYDTIPKKYIPSYYY